MNPLETQIAIAAHDCAEKHFGKTPHSVEVLHVLTVWYRETHVWANKCAIRRVIIDVAQELDY